MEMQLLETEYEESEIFICSICGCEHDINEINEFCGKKLCHNCYENNTATCADCGHAIWISGSIYDEDIYLCEECYNRHYCRCYDCGTIIHNGNALYYDDYAYCQSCYNDLNVENDYDDDNSDEIIHSYYYKPYPIFYGEGIHYGVELEVDGGGEDNNNAEAILEIGNDYGKHIYIKHDGSLSKGFEIVSHPMSLSYHKNYMNWHKIMDRLTDMGYLSHKANTCGLHLHIEKAKLGTTLEQQEETVSNILYFVEKHWHELLKFSRRTSDQIQKWASRYGYKDSPKEILDCAKNGSWGRYVCVNLQNEQTVEMRMFRGTLKYSTFIATLQLTDEICNVALSLSEEELTALTWTEFVKKIDKMNKPELVEYLKSKNLYVNEPVDNQEEDE